jgi:hypothetical protein
MFHCTTTIIPWLLYCNGSHLLCPSSAAMFSRNFGPANNQVQRGLSKGKGLADLLQFDLRSKETEVFGPFCFHQARISL